jgi:hypothetical protein
VTIATLAIPVLPFYRPRGRGNDKIGDNVDEPHALPQWGSVAIRSLLEQLIDVGQRVEVGHLDRHV